MMRLWFNSYTRAAPAVSSAAISTIAHAALISAWIVATLPANDVATESIANHVFYIPPPDRVPTQPGSRPSIHYIELATPGPGTGDGPRTVGNVRPVSADETVGQKTEQKDSVASPAAPPTNGPDSVYSVLEVDVAVVRSASSAAPAYPLKLLQQHISGSVSARYIVDTTGFADSASFTVITATHPDFVNAVREVLPYMRFEPAKIGGTKVRQLVEQSFAFKITDTGKVVPAKPKKP